MSFHAKFYLGAILATLVFAAFPASAQSPLESLRHYRAEAVEMRKARATLMRETEARINDGRLQSALGMLPDILDADADRDAAVDMVAACRTHDWDACHGIATLFAAGEQVWRDMPLAYSVFWLGCVSDHGPSCHSLYDQASLADFPYDGSFPGTTFFETACAAGSMEACDALARAYRDGRGVATDNERAAEIIDFMCAMGSDSVLCRPVTETRPEDHDTRMARLKAECETGDARACLLYSRNLRGSDPSAAVAAAERSCTLGEMPGCRYVVRLYDDWRLDVFDPGRATQMLEAICEMDPRTCRDAAERYSGGVGVAQDFEKAIELHLLACAARGRTARCGPSETLRYDPLTPETDQLVVDVLRGDLRSLREGCADGDARSCRDMAVFADAYGTPQLLLQQAPKLFARACLLGDPLSCASARSGSVDDAMKADFAAACAAGDDAGCVEAALWQTGRETRDRLDTLDALCGNDNAPACALLGELYSGRTLAPQARFGRVQTDWERAMSFSARACELGDGKGCAWVGWAIDPLVRNGTLEMFVSDAIQAQAYYKRGCTLGSHWACEGQARFAKENGAFDTGFDLVARACILGNCSYLFPALIERERRRLVRQSGVFDAAIAERYDEFHTDWRGTARRLVTMCRADDSQACHDLGHLYSGEPDGYELAYRLSDPVSADALFLHACDAGLGEACSRYAALFHHSARHDPATSLIYALKGCDAGSGSACYLAGYIDELGEPGTVRNLARASTHFEKACRLSGGYACERIGVDDGDPQRALLACAMGASRLCVNLARYDYPDDTALQIEMLRIGCEDGSEDACDALHKM